MPTALRCPFCNHSGELPEDARGRVVRCRECGKNFLLPTSGPGERPRARTSLPPFHAPGKETLVGVGPLASAQDTQSTTEDDLFELDQPDQSPASRGPLSMKGLQAQPLRSITLGDFQIFRKLGTGSMGAVYHALERSTNREVALKVLLKHLALQPAYVERFHREASAMARLNHPGILRIYGVGVTKGFHCIAMELVKGFTVAALQANQGGRFRLDDALFLVLRAAEALQHAHEHSIIHRDVKPQNILITQLGAVKLTDLGLAKPMDEDLSLTDSGLGVGTPLYMAPEQILNAKRADHRCDVYALGAVLYEMLTGRPPFQEDSAVSLLKAKEQGHFPPVRRLNPDVPSRVGLMLDKMLACDLRYRYASCADLIRDVRALGLAREHLSFNVLRVGKVLPDPSIPEADARVEVLFIHDDPTDILLAQEALEESKIPSNLTVVQTGTELAAFLRREGAYVSAAQPDLVMVGLDLARKGNGEVLRAIKSAESLCSVPLIVLGTSEGADEALRSCGLEASVHVTKLADLERFHHALQQGMAVTVVARLVP